MASRSGAGSSLPQFVLLFVGVACIVAGIWNIPRQREVEELESQRAGLQDTLNEVQVESARYARMRDAYQNDPHYREGMLRIVSGERLDGELTVEEWIRLREADPGAEQ